MRPCALSPALYLSAAAVATALSVAIAAQSGQPTRPAGWSDATHGSRVSPDYRRLFALGTVHELRLTIPRDEFQKMQADLATLTPPMFGPGGPGGRPGGPGGPGGRGGFGGRPGGPGRGGFGPGGDPQEMQAMFEAGIKACVGKAPEAACSANGMDGKCGDMLGALACVPEFMANMMRGGGAPRLTTRDPIYVPVSVTHDGRTWTNVAMRYKGNSSLASAFGQGNGKVPFRLDFSRNARTDPRIAGQRFYGFKELTFSSNFADDSQIREVLGNEIFRDRGVPAPRAAFYRVVVDTGGGPEYWGLYTMVEDPSDGAMLDSQLGGRASNLYKPDGPGSDWTRFDKEGFEKKTNEDAADFRDVERAIAALHAPRTDAARWRADLEKAFDVDRFLRWLAVNTAIENWDTYGAMAHNYYLYGDPKNSGRLQWIPWDNNMSFGVGPGGPGRGAPGGPRFGGPGGPRGGFGPPPGGAPGQPGGPGEPPPFFAMMMGGGDVLHRNAGARWPLLEKLMNDAVYSARYRQYLRDAFKGAYAPDAFAKRARQLHAMVAPHVVGPRGERETHSTISSADAFKQAVDGPNGLIAVAKRRETAIREALAAK